jgi:hypothetical protein
MNAATVLYAAAGAGAIVVITTYLIADAIDWSSGYPALVPWRGRWIVATTVLLVGWLVSTVLR